jgi:DNA (cytosine-5)-methyltransferase 1
LRANPLLNLAQSRADTVDLILKTLKIIQRHDLPLETGDCRLARVARGMQRYVLGAENPFVVELPDGQTAAPSVQRFNTGATGQDLRESLATITANSYIKKPGGAAPLGLVTPHLMSLKNTARRSCDAQAPHPTVLASGTHSALIVPALTYAQQGGRNRNVTDPHHTITASQKDQNSVVAPLLVQLGYGERKGQAPRALNIQAPLGTVVAGSIKHAAVAPVLIGCGGRAAQSRPRAGNEPVATITAKADTLAPFLAQHNKARSGFNPGRTLEAPISAVTATGSQQSINAPWFVKYYGTAKGVPCNDPMHTVTVKDRMGHMQAELAAPTFSPEHEARAREVADFLRSQGVWDGGEFVTVTIKGQEFVVVDIGMRMLTPRELFNAQGFPPDYVIEGVWSLDTKSGEWKFHPFPKNVQVSCCGNSVCPGLAKALAAANCGHLIATEEPAKVKLA